ncbi:MAG: class I SAM-dependent RNA methyltransferase [Desulfobulbaceae bacterium]
MQVCIEKIITGGQGLARREDGMVVLTRFVLPGETVEVRETRQHRGYVEADLVRVLESAPGRVAPACPYYGVCGGCDLQHISGPVQLRTKEDICREAFLRAGILLEPEMLRPILSSPQAYHYRCRIRLKVDPNGQPGFSRFRSNRVVRIDQCPVATELLNAALRGLQACPLPKSLAAVIREIDLLHSPADNRIHALLLPDPGKHVDQRRLAAHAVRLTGIQAVWLKTREGTVRLAGDSGPDLLRQDFDPGVCGSSFSLRWPPGCFSQVNAAQNVRLLSLVQQLAGPLAGRRVLDLFCGMGNFSVPLALAGAKVTGVELSRESVAWAENNTVAAGCAAAAFLTGDVETTLGTSDIRNAGFELIVLDPPRQGLGKAGTRLAELNVGRIIYISCDPATLVRDLARICGRGYRLRHVTPVDMFPQTHHIETVALLEKN